MYIDALFDGGNIEVLSSNQNGNFQLAIRKDVGGVHLQWFHFRLCGARNTRCQIDICNAGETSYPKGWQNYKAVASYDRNQWFRVKTTYKDGILHIQHQPKHDVIWFAYFAPYSFQRHQDMIAQTQLSKLVEHQLLGRTLDGRSLDLLKISAATTQHKNIWVIGRQHPGETMAQWFIEGFLQRILNEDDPISNILLTHANFWVVPNMNPDGSVRGHLRCNAVGANLNREWQNPSLERSPEVFNTLARMDKTGCDLCMDVHGDEALPYNFIAGAEGIPNWTPRLAALQKQFAVAYERANPDFQQKYGYPITPPGQANMTVCSNQIAQRFDCLAVTLEQPFKDNADYPNPEKGWSPERAKLLGASALDAIYSVIHQLRN